MKRSSILVLALGALAAACAPPPPAPPPATPPPPVTTAAPTAPPAPPPAPAKAAATPAPEGPFHAVATLTAPPDAGLDVSLFTLGSEIFLGRVQGGRQRIFRVRDGAVSRDEVTVPDGSRYFGRVKGLHGRWPEPAYLVTVTLDGGGRYHNTWNLFRHDPVAKAGAPGGAGHVWKPILQHDDPNSMAAHMSPESVGPSWDGELALFGDGRVLGRFNDRLRVLDGPKAPLPVLTTAAECKGRARVAFGDWNESSKLLALPSGHLVVAGNDCAGGGLALEHFAPGATRGSVVTFGKECVLREIAGTRIDALVLLARCHDDHDELFDFDGKQASPIAYPPGSNLKAIAVTAGGVLHVVDHGANVLRKRAPGGAWQAIPLGDAGGAIGVIGEDDVWLFDGRTLWRNRAPAGPPQEFTWPADDAQVATSFRAPRAATSACESIFVLFFGFARTTPESYDFPLTRAALKGHAELEGARLVVTRDGGRKYFGAFAPTLGLARQLAATVQRGVADARPEILCAKPELVREIPFDWATGAVTK